MNILNFKILLTKIFKRKYKNEFQKQLIADWGKEDIFGPWTKIDKEQKKIKFYKSYYLISDNKPVNFDIFE